MTKSAEMQPAQPLLTDVYDIGEQLGHGAFSVVKQGIHKQTGQKVALKMIPIAQYTVNPRKEQLIRTEIAIMRRIKTLVRHPSIMQMHGVYEDEVKITLALEFLGGKELFDRILQRGQYSEADAAKLMRKLVGAVHELHAHGILHRDLKPENCMYDSMDEDAEIKITDFGLGAISQSRRPFAFVDKYLVGTPGYVAPEVLARREYSPACDVWSLGVMLYILLVGYPPFYNPNQAELFEQIKAGRYAMHPEAWSCISEPAKDLVRRMLVVDSSKRITTAAILSHPWIVGHHTPTVHLETTVQRIKKFNAKIKFKAAVMALIWGGRYKAKKKLKDLVGSHSFTNEEVALLREHFEQAARRCRTADRADSTTTGETDAVAETTDEIDFPEFQRVMSTLGFGHLPLDRVFELFDRDGNNKVDYKEFLVGLSCLRSEGEATMKFCFDVYDRDKSGFISRAELESVLFAFASDQESVEELKAEKLAEVFDRLDTNKDDQISFEEFKAGIATEPILVQAFLQPLNAVLASRMESRETAIEELSEPESSVLELPVPPCSLSYQKSDSTLTEDSMGPAKRTGDHLRQDSSLTDSESSSAVLKRSKSDVDADPLLQS